MTHELKILPEYYNAVRSGKKKFELRKDDRDFAEGDRLWLREWDPEEGYTGKAIMTNVTYILRGAMKYGLSQSFCIMSIGKIKEKKRRQAPAGKRHVGLFEKR